MSKVRCDEWAGCVYPKRSQGRLTASSEMNWESVTELCPNNVKSWNDASAVPFLKRILTVGSLEALAGACSSSAITDA